MQNAEYAMQNMRLVREPALGWRRNSPASILHSAFCILHSPVCLCAAAVCLFGCQTPGGPIFPAVYPPIVWPRPPDRARIQYVGELTGEASLLAAPSGWAAVRALFEGPPPKTAFTSPAAVAVAGERLYVADSSRPSGPAVFVLDLSARTFSAWREADGAPFESPIDVAVADGRVAVVDARRAAVFLFESDGRFVRTIGKGVLARPSSVAWQTPTRELCVVDAAAHTCVVFDIDGGLKRRIGQRGAGPGQFNFPTAACAGASVATAPPSMLVVDAMNFRVQILDAAGGPVLTFGRKGDAAGSFSLPRDVAVDSDGNIYVVDNQFENVQIFNQRGDLLMAFGQEGAGPGQFNVPSGITIDERDRIWIADTRNRRVQVFQYLKEDATWAQ
jgi:DNA-binding beta-propeller fold protein YncE